MARPPDLYKLSPSDFAFLWEQCKRCFYLKVTRGIRQPSMPMAGIFKRIEGLQMEFYDGKPTREVCPDLPAGIIRCGERWVESEPIRPPGRRAAAYVVGKLDSLIEFEDASWGVIDFKTTETKGEHLDLYGRQLNAYAYALQNPSGMPRALRGAPLRLSPISRLGLLCMEPTELRQPEPGRHCYEGKVRWIEIAQDARAFQNFVGEILALLEGPLPDPDPECDWCQYVRTLADNPPAAPSAPPARPPAGADSCPSCGAPMVQKSGRYGPFLSCTRYPDCRGTRDLGRGRKPSSAP